MHSVYVDQWDWEKHIDPSDRTLAYLMDTVKKLYKVFKATERETTNIYPELTPVLPDEITFIHAEELLQRYPEMSVKERENVVAKEYGAVFIIGIGGALSNGEPHDGRAPDYDDWSTLNESGYRGLNGDIVLYNPVLQSAFEVSSMGIRVDKETLLNQLKIRDVEERTELHFHKMLLSDHLPQSIGGGIGQSRVCMFMLKKKHIGEVQVSIWPEEERKRLAAEGVFLL
jgi:aspartate--ammonia ligase